jgi:hypothetical protein
MTGADASFAVKELKASPTSAAVLVDGQSVSFDAYNIADSNYFKLRDLAYVLNGTGEQFSVTWDGAANTIALTSGAPYTPVGGEMAKKGSAQVKPVSSAATLLIDGNKVGLNAYQIGGNNYFRLRDIGEALDFGVEWDGGRNSILIDTSKSYTPD